MVDNTWAYENETKIIGILNAYAIPALKKKFAKNSKIQFNGTTITNLSSRLSKPTFPTIYVKEIGFAVNGKTLEAKEITSITPTYQVKTITNTSQEDAHKILAIVADVFQQMMFENLQGLPFEDSTSGVYTCTTRFKRTIDKHDRLI